MTFEIRVFVDMLFLLFLPSDNSVSASSKRLKKSSPGSPELASRPPDARFVNLLSFVMTNLMHFLAVLNSIRVGSPRAGG